MKKVILALAVLLICFASSSTAYAGSLNVYENEIVEAAKKTYEYNGIKYEVDPAYLNQLVEYLSRDDIDLTAEDRDLVLETAYGSVESGVSEGYLVPAKVVETQEAITPTQEATATVTPVAENADTSSEDTPTSSDTGAITPAADDEGDSNTEQISEEPKTDTSTIIEKEITSPEKLIEDILGAEQAAEDNIFDMDNNAASAGSSIIKDTGFNFTNTILVIGWMGMLMLIGSIVTIRCNFFAHTDE